MRTLSVILALGLGACATGCATARNLRAASALTGCPEEQLEETAWQPAHEKAAAEPVAALGWYDGCDKKVVCGDETCLETQVGPPATGEPLLVLDGNGVRARQEYRLPGLTHQQTARRAEIIKLRQELATPVSGSCGGGFGGLGGGSGSGAGALIIIPVILAVVVVTAIACGAGAAAESDRKSQRATLEEELAALDAELKPSGLTGCTPEDYVELARITINAERVCSSKDATDFTTVDELGNPTQPGAAPQLAPAGPSL